MKQELVPLLSIITINYNNYNGLKSTVNSVIKQTFKDFEYLVVDGASSDKSVSFLKENQKYFSFYISEKDTGIYNAMNKGVRKATGKYLLFLNSGDCLNGKNILRDIINNKDFFGDIIYGDYKFLEGEKKYPDLLTPLFFIKSSLPHQSSLIKRELFNEVGLYNEDYQISSDREFFIKCFLSGKYEFNHINTFITLFDLEGISNNPNYLIKKNIEDKEILKNNFKEFYVDYIYLLALESKINMHKKNTLKGILKRIITKIKFYGSTSS